MISQTAYYDENYEGSAENFIQGLTAAYFVIPESYRSNATITVSSYEAYDRGSVGVFKLEYLAPETFEMVESRIRKANKNIKYQEMKDFAEYERLKGKFESKNNE